ncbi:OmpA family protein [Chitinophaga sancti]|uniref:OmpA family protein n=1 Tax=Chitinophaga sancti TaxID=1004 RepID=A0A1K1RYE9_9BACT|nr:OmpA family protein [Chitinophaga sancti]WQD64112.1 OmpA family protein [Chitinophaga sancti]WQG90264.1 OmpA family protein [Chitinophaga sancti]SFW77097.1 WD40-like Beta Propeller Repeat [Chitinophaga sancti]
MNKKIALFSIMLLSATLSNAQYVLKEADKQASLYNYTAAIPLYKKAFSKKISVRAIRGVADSYKLLNEYPEAETWYRKLVALPEHTANDELHYAKVLINNAKYTAAKEALDGYLAKQPNDILAMNMQAGCDSAAKWNAKPVKGDLENLKAMNTQWSDWGTGFRTGRFVFASDRPYDSLRHDKLYNNSNISRKRYGFTGRSYFHLYESDGFDSSTTRLLSRNVNGDYHSAKATYTADGNTMYYAVTNLVKKKSRFAEQLYTLNVELKASKWNNTNANWEIDSFPYNEIFNYSVGDPFISADGRTLYFVADYGTRGLGSTDIYYCTRGQDGKWQTPVNMGPSINTAGSERTPFMDSTGVFYFATDGRPGVGGLDIFSAKQKDGVWYPVNMGAPVNSAQDDFGPAYNTGKSMYFSSNRAGGYGNDDIYRFTPWKILVFSLEGKAFDKATKAPLGNATVALANKATGNVLTTGTDDEGNYKFVLDSLSDYGLNATRVTYSPSENVLVTTNGLTASQVIHQDVFLPKIVIAQVAAPEKKTLIVAKANVAGHKIDLGNRFNPANVYFDLGKSAVRPDAAKELDKLIALMKENPQWKLMMGFHTDSRSDDNYNMKLSQKRAASVLQYFISKGIAKERMTATGYGETRLINRCANGVHCSEQEHQANRRTEFEVFDR